MNYEQRQKLFSSFEQMSPLEIMEVVSCAVTVLNSKEDRPLDETLDDMVKGIRVGDEIARGIIKRMEDPPLH